MTVAYLEVLDGPGDLRAVEGRLTIGRGRAADLVLADDSVSRSHAAVWPEGSTVVVEDLDSSNGTWVNGERMDGRQRLHDGDVVRIGQTELRYER